MTYLFIAWLQSLGMAIISKLDTFSLTQGKHQSTFVCFLSAWLHRNSILEEESKKDNRNGKNKNT